MLASLVTESIIASQKYICQLAEYCTPVFRVVRRLKQGNCECESSLTYICLKYTHACIHIHRHKHTKKQSHLTKRLLQTRMILEPRKYQLIGVLAVDIMIIGEREKNV